MSRKWWLLVLVFCGLCNSSFGQAEGDSDRKGRDVLCSYILSRVSLMLAEGAAH